MKVKFYLLIFLLSWKDSSTSYFTEIEKCKLTTLGKEYIGNVDKSINGTKCVPWSQKKVEQLHLEKKTYVYLNSTMNNNYCRNPTNFPNGPWCFVNSNTMEWEYCNISFCYKDRNWCKDSKSETEYIGMVRISKSGDICRPWINQENYQAKHFPENSLSDAENFCRNPTRESFGPWCYTVNSYPYGKVCNIPSCDTTLNQVEYFGGYDFLKTITDQHEIVKLDKLYSNIIFTVSVKSKLWTIDIERKTSLWATDYNVKCQRDFNAYVYCQLSSFHKTNDENVLVYSCTSPLRTLIFVSPLHKSQYKFEYKLGKIYVLGKPSIELSEYELKTNKYLSQRNMEINTIPIASNYGSFYLLYGNVIPYAVTPDKEVVFTISEVGQGRIGFMGSESYISERFLPHLKDFFNLVYGEKNVSPLTLTVDLLNSLYSNRTSGQLSRTFLIWNSHYKIGLSSSNLLINLIKDGLRIIIGIKPWAYDSYRNKLDTSELKSIFIVSGISPTLKYLNKNLTALNKVELEVIPLVHLLNYAAINISNAISQSHKIVNILVDSYYLDDLHNYWNFDSIRESMKSLFEIYLPYVRYIVPCYDNPLTNDNDKKLIDFFYSLMIQPFGNKFIAPGVNFYPGIIYSNNIRHISVEMQLNLKFKGDAVQLGLYMSPGEDVSVKMTKSKSQICKLHVNYHLIYIYSTSDYYKWPKAYKALILKLNELQTFSFGFGGLLSISCDENDNNVDITLNGVIQVPMYDRRDNEINKYWNKMKQTNSPWAIVSSDTVVFIVPSITIRNLARPDIIMDIFDSMIKEEFHLRGRSINGTYREMISIDVQIKLGYMHSGYPIGTSMMSIASPYVNWYVFNKNFIEKNGAWGILHEIGHNIQHSLFTFDGSSEVTNNIFSLVGDEAITGINGWSVTGRWFSTSTSYISNIVSYIKNGNFSRWKLEPFVALGTYMQLRNSFGWEFYSQIFRRYNVLINEGKSYSDEKKIQLWIKESSIIAKMNLCPHYDLWKWPIENETNVELSKFPYFLPDDFLTKRVENQVNEIIVKYGGSRLVMREPNAIPILVGPLTNKSAIEGEKIIKRMLIVNERK